LVLFAMLFLPMAIFFLHRDWRRYWLESIMLIFISVAFLVAGFNRDENSWISAIDDLGPADRRK